MSLRLLLGCTHVLVRCLKKHSFAHTWPRTGVAPSLLFTCDSLPHCVLLPPAVSAFLSPRAREARTSLGLLPCCSGWMAALASGQQRGGFWAPQLDGGGQQQWGHCPVIRATAWFSPMQHRVEAHHWRICSAVPCFTGAYEHTCGYYFRSDVVL